MNTMISMDLMSVIILTAIAALSLGCALVLGLWVIRQNNDIEKYHTMVEDILFDKGDDDDDDDPETRPLVPITPRHTANR